MEQGKDNITRLHTYITDVSTTPLETKLPRPAWVTFNRLRTDIGRFLSNIYEFSLAPSAACECGEEQTADHIVNNCLIYNSQNGKAVYNHGQEDEILVAHNLPGI